MQNTSKRRGFRTRESRVRKKRIKKSIFIVFCIVFIVACIAIMDKGKYLNNVQKNSVASSTKKIQPSQISEGNYVGKEEPVKNEVKAQENKVQAKITKNSSDEINNTSVSSQGKNQINNEGVNAEQALVNDGKKTAYLTFDDGPSVTVTPKVLDVLKQYKVNATFFVIGSSVDEGEKSKQILKRSFEEGNAFGNHTYTHNLKTLYPNKKLNVEYFMEEVDKTNNLLKNVLGQDFNTRVIRMPGGYMSRQYYKDPNLAAFDDKLKKMNMCSIDWNAYDFDSEGKKKNAKQLLDEVKKSVGTQEKAVILMHDTYGKEETANALPQIIEYLKAEGYELKTLK